MPDLPYSLRLLALLGFALIMVLVDVLRKGREARRHREYGFVLGVALLGALFGVVVDQGTVTVSPEYFVLGKGLKDDGTLRGQVLELGFQAGFFGGLVVAMGLLLVNNPRPDCPALSYGRLLRLALLPLFGAVVLAPLFSLVAWGVDPLGKLEELKKVMKPPEARGFLIVWGLHLGLYVGALGGLITALGEALRARESGALAEQHEDGEDGADAHPEVASQ